MAPIVAEVYGTHYPGQIEAAKALRSLFENTDDIVDVDDWVEADQPKWLIDIDRQRAAHLGVSQSSIVQAVNTALGGEDVSYLHVENNKYPLPIRLELSEGNKVNLSQLLVMKVRQPTAVLFRLVT